MSVSGISRALVLIAVLLEAPSRCDSLLIGDHVCPRVENYTVTSYETYTEPVVVNTFTWCLQIPPRCPKRRTELRQRYRAKTQEKSRAVEECCDGYRISMIHENASVDARCLPFCKKCLAGLCVAPNECQCNPGYQGDDCARECPSGFWGLRCAETCDCGGSNVCDPANGVCRCPAGLRGPRCEEKCAIDRWGADCANECICQNRDNGCDAVTGRCIIDDENGDVSSVERTSPTYLASSTTEPERTLGISSVKYLEVIPAPHDTVEHQTEDVNGNRNDANYIPETTIPATTSIATSPQSAATNDTRARVPPPTTARPVIVLVSVPERRRDVKDMQKFATENAFFRNVRDGEDAPKIDYVKTVRKDDDVRTSTPIPLDVALIVVAAIVSLGLTSVAVVMVLHMRSKLFETVRLAVYDDGKIKSAEGESAKNGGKTSAVINASLPAPPIRANPAFTANAEPDAILTVDGIESLNTYANGATMIGLRISGNLRDLLQDSHYDRPAATLVRLQTSCFDHNTEHVYDEIPFQAAPLSSRRDT